MRVERLKIKVGADLLLEAPLVEGRSVGITSFTYPNGDSVNLYFDDLGDTLSVSDEGATLAFIRNQNIELTQERRETIKTICRPYDVEFVTPLLRKNFSAKEIGVACLSLCEAITAVASIHYHVISPLRSSLPVAIGKLLRARVKPKRAIEPQWTDRRHDPKGSFPVDFHINGIGEARNIFSVTSPGKSAMVAAVVSFLRSHRVTAPALAVIDKEAGLGNRDLNRLQLTCDSLAIGLDGHENQIVKFALSGLPK